MDEGGSVDEASLSVSEEALWREPGGGAPSLGTLEDMLIKSLDTAISLHGGPFPAEGNLVCGGGSYTRDFDRWMKEGSNGGASLCEGFHEGVLGGGLLYWGTRKMRFLRDMQNAL